MLTCLKWRDAVRGDGRMGAAGGRVEVADARRELQVERVARQPPRWRSRSCCMQCPHSFQYSAVQLAMYNTDMQDAAISSNLRCSAP